MQAADSEAIDLIAKIKEGSKRGPSLSRLWYFHISIGSSMNVFELKLTLIAVSSVTISSAGSASFYQPNIPAIVDSNGNFVGYPFGRNLALIPLQGQLVAIPTFPSGFANPFVNEKTQVVYYHLTADCSGLRYLVADTLPLYGYVISNSFVFPSGQPKSSQIMSTESFSLNPNNSNGPLIKNCMSVSMTLTIAPVSSFPTSAVPPFSIPGSPPESR